MPDWDAIKNEYITTRIGQRALAKKYNVTLAQVSDRSKREGWVEARVRFRDKTLAKSLDRASDKAAQYKNRIFDLADKMARQLEEIIDRGNVAEMGLKPRDVTGAIKDIADILDVKSEAAIREQEARIRKLEAEAKRSVETDEGKEIVVRIDGGAPGWSE